MRAIRNALDAARLTVVSALAVMLAMTTATRTLAQTPAAGSITSASGAVQVQSSAGTANAGSGTALNVGDRIITGPGGHAVITLTDGSQLELGESSNLVIDNHSLAPSGGRAATQVSLFGGVLRSVVNATGGARNFEVHTPNAVAAVRGTRWDTAYSDADARPTFGDCRKFTDVVVYEGVVSVRNPNASNGEDVPAGYEVTVPCSISPLLPGPIGMTGAHSASAGIPSVIGGVPPPSCPVCPPVQAPPVPPVPPAPPPGM